MADCFAAHLRSGVVRAARVRLYAATAALALSVAACGIGVRPTLAAPSAVGGEAGTPTGIAAADAVLHLLEGEQVPTFTAEYTIRTNFGDKTTKATVARSGDRRSVTIGNIRFLTDGDRQTCDLDTGQCESGIQEARVSDTGLTSQFSAASPARQLRVSLTRRTRDPSSQSPTADQSSAVCVVVPVGDGEEQTCALPEGVIGTWRTAAVDVHLDHISDTVDPAAFDTHR
jgi:hypothetical protein